MKDVGTEGGYSADPTRASLKTLLAHAARQRAAQIRIQMGSARHGSLVSFLIADEWREQLRIPKHIHASLAEHIGSLSGEDALNALLNTGESGADVLITLRAS